MSSLTPFEKLAKSRENQNLLNRAIQATQELVKQFEEIDKGLDDPSPAIRLQCHLQDELSEEAIIRLAQGLEELFGISA